MSYQNHKEATIALNTLITQLRSRKATTQEIANSLRQWAQREFTDSEEDNKILKRVRNQVFHPDKIQQNAAIGDFSVDNMNYLHMLASKSGNFNVFLDAIPAEITSQSQLEAEKDTQDSKQFEDEKQHLIEEQTAYLTIEERLKEIRSKLNSTNLNPEEKQSLLTEYTTIKDKLKTAKKENNTREISKLTQENVGHNEYYGGMDSIEQKMNRQRIKFIEENIQILRRISDQIATFESLPSQKVEPKKLTPLSEEQALQKMHRVLSTTLDAGKDAIKRHDGSETNPGKQVRVEYNFKPYNDKAWGFASDLHVLATKKALIELGLIEPDYETPYHGRSAFIAIKPTAENRLILSDPNFEATFSQIYEQQKVQVELETIRDTLKYSINDGQNAVTIHPGSAANPGVQVRIEYNFPPHNENGSFNANHYNAVKKALIDLGLIDKNYLDQFHNKSPFIVIKPTANNSILNNPDIIGKLQEVYHAHLIKDVMLPDIDKNLALIDKGLQYVQDPAQSSNKQLQQEKSLNDAINYIINLVQNGDPAQGLPPHQKWFDENEALINAWLKSDYVTHSVKQELQKIAKPEQYYSRNYEAKDPLINLVTKRLLQQEKESLGSKSFPGGFNISLEIDRLLRRLETLDKEEKAPHERAAAISGLLTEDSKKTNDNLKKILSKLQNDPDYQKLLASQIIPPSPKTITLAAIAENLKEIEGAIEYLQNSNIHNALGIKRKTTYLNAVINQIITLAQKGDEQKGIKPYPNWLAENTSLMNNWLQNSYVTAETKQRVEHIIKLQSPSAKSAVTPAAPANRSPSPTPQVKAARRDLPQPSAAPANRSPSPTPQVKAARRNLPQPPAAKAAQSPLLRELNSAKLGVNAASPAVSPNKAPPPPPPRGGSGDALKAAPPPPPPRGGSGDALKAAPPPPPPRGGSGDALKATPPPPPPRSGSGDALKAAPPPPPPRGGSGKAAPPPVPPRADAKIVPEPLPRAQPQRKSFLPAEQAAAKVSAEEFNAELKRKLQQREPLKSEQPMAADRLKNRSSGKSGA